MIKVNLLGEAVDPSRHIPCLVTYDLDGPSYNGNLALVIADAANEAIDPKREGSWHPMSFNPVAISMRQPLYMLNGRPC